MDTTQEKPVHGLSCPRCGGIVSIPEGQAIVCCPYCDMRSVVAAVPSPAEAESATAEAETSEGTNGGGWRGMSILRGARRYQAPVRVGREQAVDAMRRFLSGKFQIARDAEKKAEISEVFLVHLPFWAVWGRGMAWAFGQVRRGSGDNVRYEPDEKKALRELTWNMPACDVGEFGVREISLDGCPLEPFEPEALHRTGMVFEPVGSVQSALTAAEEWFSEQIISSVKLNRTAQIFTRLVHSRIGLVYYPLWVLRYRYHGRSFQVVVDGVRGDVLYGKAPGSVGYRAVSLVGGAAVGSLVAVDLPALILMLSYDSDDDGGAGGLALVAFIFGLAILYAGYNAFRYGEHYEYHRYGGKRSRKKKGAAAGSGVIGADVIQQVTGISPDDLGGIREAVKQLEDIK
ncbi:MAG: hypothetical protein GX491_00180 [Chloroflexi bacterium]|nr:hypothetical protein [Chloroflexota bacterium]